ncbi:uncharacterized protein BDV14DRAFT_172864 [Aspergillus stella-maris]|uniref:uncharacterized protein n=1 Tax=Aspergillus stella-maris TaxID=1810926 RepID=UPI003CCE4A8B
MNFSPRTLTSSVPSLASSKQWPLSQCDVYTETLCPVFWSARPTSMIRRSAPPMPRSGWIIVMCGGFCGGLSDDILGVWRRVVA